MIRHAAGLAYTYRRSAVTTTMPSRERSTTAASAPAPSSAAVCTTLCDPSSTDVHSRTRRRPSASPRLADSTGRRAEPFAHRPQRRLGSGAQAKLGQDVAHVCPGGPLADHQLAGDLLIGLALRHQHQDFSLTRG